MDCNEKNEVIWETFENDLSILLDDTPLDTDDYLLDEIKIEDINESQKMPQV